MIREVLSKLHLYELEANNLLSHTNQHTLKCGALSTFLAMMPDSLSGSVKKLRTRMRQVLFFPYIRTKLTTRNIFVLYEYVFIWLR